MTCHVEKRDKYYLLASRGITGFLLAGPAIVALWHFFGTGSGPFVNDMLLHQLEVNRIASIFSAAEEFPAKSASHNLGSFVQSLNVMHAWLEKWTWALVCACDHVLGGHGLGFPLLHHYQHLPHLVVGFAGAILEVILNPKLRVSHECRTVCQTCCTQIACALNFNFYPCTRFVT